MTDLVPLDHGLGFRHEAAVTHPNPEPGLCHQLPGPGQQHLLSPGIYHRDLLKLKTLVDCSYDGLCASHIVFEIFPIFRRDCHPWVTTYN